MNYSHKQIVEQRIKLFMSKSKTNRQKNSVKKDPRLCILVYATPK